MTEIRDDDLHNDPDDIIENTENTIEFQDDHHEPDQVRIDVALTIDGDWKADPLKLMSGLREGMRSLDRWQRKGVKAARKQGRSWDEIGAACGVSRQAAWERFRDISG
jgi:hypothetical protein